MKSSLLALLIGVGLPLAVAAPALAAKGIPSTCESSVDGQYDCVLRDINDGSGFKEIWEVKGEGNFPLYQVFVNEDGTINISVQYDPNGQLEDYKNVFFMGDDPACWVEDKGREPLELCVRPRMNMKNKVVRATGNDDSVDDSMAGRTNGFKVRKVFFDRGAYVRGKDGRWTERGEDGEVTFKFVEVDANEDEVFLEDRSRGVRITLNLADNMIYYSDRKRKTRPLYPITEWK